MEFCQSFEAVDKSCHQLKAFDCGQPQMNQFLSRFAVKHARQGLSRTMVLPVNSSGERKKAIAAYYTLAASTLLRQDIPTSDNLPPYPIPVVLLGRLAVDRRYQKMQLGEKSLLWALRHSVRLCDEGLPAYGLVLDVLNEQAMSFYQRFECFYALTDNPNRLFVPMTVLRQL